LICGRRRKLKIKIVILLVAMALLVGVLSGCVEEKPTNAAPEASFTVPTNVYVNTEATFTDTSTDDSEVTSWSWDFDGDGVEDSDEQNPAYTFDTVGTYTVNLTVTDAAGETSTATETVTVGYTPPAIAITVPETVTNNTAATFTATVTLVDGTVEDTGYAWYIDDVEQADMNTSTLEYTFTTTGDHTVKVMVTDSNSLTAEDTQTVTVAEETTE
jgi:hypothetical protein